MLENGVGNLSRPEKSVRYRIYNDLPVLCEFRLTYLVPALVATTREAIKVIIRGALIRGGGAEDESSIRAADLAVCVHERLMSLGSRLHGARYDKNRYILLKKN